QRVRPPPTSVLSQRPSSTYDLPSSGLRRPTLQSALTVYVLPSSPFHCLAQSSVAFLACAGSPRPAWSAQSSLMESEVTFAVAVACALPTPDLEVTTGLGPSVEESHSGVPAARADPARSPVARKAARRTADRRTLAGRGRARSVDMGLLREGG